MTTDALAELLRPALAAYAAAVDAHEHTETGCSCGRPGNRRSTGMHIAAIVRQADAAYDVAVDELLAAR